jgi:hypothetical protein
MVFHLLHDTMQFPGVADKSSALLLRIREVQGSNLGPETGADRHIVIFLSPSSQIPEQYLKLGHDRFHPHPF